MPVRDRLAELQKESKHVTEKDIQKMNSQDKDEAIPMLPMKDMSPENKEFFETITLIREDINTYTNNAKTIRHLHSKILSAVRHDEHHQTRLDDLNSENLKLGAKIGRVLKEEHDKLDTMAQGKGQKQGVELRMRKNQLSTNTNLFKDSMAEYQQEMDSYKSQSKDMLSKRIRIVGGDYNEEEIDNMIAEGKLEQMYGAGHLKQTQDARRQLNELQDRHDEFKKLERSLEELASLFLQIQALVHQQGEVVDRIADQVENAAERVDKGQEQLKGALKLKIKGRKLKLIIAGVGSLLLLILILIILSEFGAFNGSGKSSPRKNK